MEGGEKSGIPLKLNPIRTRPIPAYASDEQSSSGTEDSPIWTPLGWDNGYLRFQRGKIANWFSTYFSPKSCDKPTNNHTIPPPYEASKSINLTSHKDLNRKVLKGKQICSEGEIHVPFTYIPSPLKSFSCELGPKFGVQKSSIKSKSFTDLTELLSCLDSKFVDSKEKANAELVKLMRDLKDSLAKGLLSEFQTSAQELLTISKNCINMTSYEFRNRCESIVRDLAEHKGREEAKSLLLEKYKTRMLFILTRCTRLLQFGKDNWNADGESFERFKKCLESVPAVDSANNLEGSISSTDSTPTTDKARPLSLSDQKLLENLLISSPPYSLLIKQKSLPIYKSHITETSICRICEENVPTSQLEAHSYVCAYANECDAEGAGVDERLIKIADMLETIVDAYGLDFDGNSFDSSFRSEADLPHLIEWHNKGTEGMFEDIHELDTARIIEESYFRASCNFKSLLAMKLNEGVSFSSSPYNRSVTSASSNNNTPRASHFDLFWIGHNNPSDLENINHVHRLAYVTRKVAHVDCESETAYQDLITHLHELIEILQTNPIKGLVIDTFGCRIKKLLKKKYLRVTQGGNKRSYNQQTQNNETKTTGDSGLNSSLEEQEQVQNSISSESERTSIDDFEKIKEISRGAFGKVFLAKKRTTGDLFAIKVLKKLDMIRKNDIERILAERDILIAVRNPFVVRFFYSFTCRENLYLVMEYLNGGDLYSLLRTVGCLDEKNARIYIAELVLALEYLHSVGIIHRDLKPDNILIGTNGHIKLTDFGLSKIGLIANSYNLSKPSSGSTPNRFEEISESSKRVKRRSAIGTPDYLAPEILLGTEHGCAADWWSVGIILFELITGIPPFTARSPETIFDNILNRRIPWPDVPNEISYETQDLIDRLLTLDEDLRLGVNGASEVKAHPFFNEVNWDNLALEKAAFVPCPENIGDTSYFMSRYPQNSSLNLNLNVPNSNSSSNHATATTSSSSTSIPKPTKNEELEDEDVESGSYVDISSINFSFKNLAELASMNYEVLQQSGRKGYNRFGPHLIGNFNPKK